MNRKTSVIHLVSLIAIIIGLFSPILGLPVVAEEPLPDTEAAATPISESRQLIPVTPKLPTLSEAACEDGAMFAEVATEVPTEGVLYSISAPDAEGAYLVTATLADASIYTWADSGLDGWTVDGTTATSIGTVTLCPPAEDPVDSEESSEPDAVVDGEDETPEDLAEPTTGRGRARDTGTMRAMGINATSTELEISKSASKTSDVAGGDEIVYTISVANNTGADHHYSLTDVLPEGVTYQSHTVPYPADGDECTESAGTVTCGLAEGMVLYPGWTDVWTITVTVNNPVLNEATCPASLTNNVIGDWGGSASATFTFTTDACLPGLSFSFEIDTPVISRYDQQISFTATLTNTSTVPATDVRLVIPVNALFEASLSGWIISNSSATGTCKAINPELDCLGLTVPGRVGNEPGVVVVNFSLPAGQVYPPALCTTHTFRASYLDFPEMQTSIGIEKTLQITCDARLEMSISADKSEAVAGDIVTYTFEIRNIGSGSFTAKPSTNIFEFVPQGGMNPLPGGISTPDLYCDVPGSTYFCFFHPLAPIGAGKTLTIDLPMQAMNPIPPDACGVDTGTVLTNTSSQPFTWENVPVVPAITLDCDPGPLRIQLGVTGANGQIGDQYAYIVTAWNDSLDEYSDPVSFTLTLPYGVVPDAGFGLPPECSAATTDGVTTITCTDVQYDEHPGLNFLVKTTQAAATHVCDGVSAGATVPITATVTGTGPEWNPSHSTDSEDIDIICNSNLTLTFTTSPSVVNPGDTATFRFDVSNPTNQFVDYSFYTVFSRQGGTTFNWDDWNYIMCISVPYPGPPTHMSCSDDSYDDGTPDEGRFISVTFEIPQYPTNETCENGLSATTTLTNGSWATHPVPITGSINVNCQQLSLTKITSEDSVVVGDEFTYTITVTNDGRNSHGSYAFTDTLPAGIELVDPTVLPDGCVDSQSAGTTAITCTRDTGPDPAGGTHQYTFRVQSDFALNTDICGEVTNTVTGTDGVWITGSATADITVDCPVEIAFSKEPISATVNPGDTIGYEITLQNLSLVPMTYVVLSDDPPALPDSGTWDVLINGEPYDFSEDLTPLLESRDPIVFRFVSSLIPEDITTESAWCGEWSNTASVDVTFANDAELHDEASASVFVNCSSLSIVKAVNSELIAPGGEVEYTITVTNDGNTDIDTLVVVDRMPTTDAFMNWQVTSNLVDAQCAVEPDLSGDLIAYCFLPTLPRDTALEMTLTGEAPLIPTREQCAPVENAATFLYFSSSPPAQVTRLAELTPPVTEVHSNTVTTQIDCQPDVDIIKTGAVDTGEDGRVDDGDMITYTFEVTNSGNMALYDITVTDDFPGLEWVSGTTIDELAPGASGTLTATYAVTQADIDTGEVVNTANVTASTVPETGPIGESGPPGETGTVTTQQEGSENTTPTSVSGTNTATTTLEQVPEIDLVKSSDGDDLESGDTITYTFTVTNIGNVTLKDMDVLDGMEGVHFDGETTIDELAPGEDAQLTATYLVTQANVDAGIIVNCADVTATAPNETTVSDDDCATDLIDQNPLLQLAYACQGPTDAFLPDVGDEVTFELTISNDGDQTLHDLAIEASREGELDTDLPSLLAPGDSATRTWTTTVSQEDYDAREITVEVTVTGETEAGFEATLTSAIAMQADTSVTTSITMTCPMADLPSTPTSTPQPVTKLPETGHGVDAFTPGLWAAAMAGLVLIGISGVRIRRKG